MEHTIEILALINDVLQAIIVIFGSAVVLYNLGRSRRIRVMRAFSALVTFVVIVYLTELLVSRIISTEVAANWLRVGWIGIAMVPAAQYHLADALLEITGAPRRRFLVRVGYLSSLLFLGLVFWTNLIVAQPVFIIHAPHLHAGPLFWLFALDFWLVTIASIYQVWQARQRCITSTTRRRMTITLLAFLAAPLAVFPYLIVSNSAQVPMTIWFWLIAITGNLVVGVMFALLTANLIYFGSASPDRVVRVRLFKFMARVPLAGTIVLFVYVIVSRNSPILGMPAETALGFALVATVMLVEWAIHAFKRPLERLFQLNDEPDVRRIQELSERLLTTADLRQFLESILAATCEALRTPTTFVAAITAEGPTLEAVVGPLAEPEAQALWQEADWRELTHPENENGSNARLQTLDDFFLWQDYWIRPLYSRQQDMVIGIFGIRARASQPDLNDSEQQVLDKLLDQAENALQDRILQQEVFAAVEGLLPQITALQERRRAATFGGLPVLTDPEGTTAVPAASVVNDPDFNTMVKDALSHYWGGPKLTKSPLLGLRVVQRTLDEYGNNPSNALRAILADAIELQKPEGERNLSTTEWILYNILELKFVQGRRVRDVARRLAMSESDLYRKQRIAIENVAQTVATMEMAALQENPADQPDVPAGEKPATAVSPSAQDVQAAS
ncbi:MAG: hypothetical protein KC441_16915 [Anaerolineales bacterium]|nr:hypothetical protein [Anaerolineales bacterium]